MKTWTSLVAAGIVALSGTAAFAEYPDKPVSFVVPWGPGDLEDLLTRMIAEDFQSEYGMAAAVVNKPSGGGGPFPGAVEVAKAPADGSMVGSFVVGVPVVGPHLGIPELAPDPFEPLGIFLTYPFVLAASSSAPYQNLDELAAHAQSNKVVLGHYGKPLIPTKVTLLQAKNAGFSYAKDAAYDVLDCNTLASGDADVINTTLQAILPCLDSVTVLAAITDERIPLIPDVPTLSEIDPALGITLWNGLFVHKDTPQDVRAKIIAVAEKSMASERAQKLAKDTGAGVYWQGPDESAARIARDIKTNAAIDAALQ